MPKSRGNECISYIISFDGGVAPNPYHDKCTLALCKPDIRRTSEVGDLIIGLSGIALGYQLVCAMYVSEVIPLGDYFNDPRFQAKKPNFKSANYRDWMGDNIYEYLGRNKYRQNLSYFNVPGRSAEDIARKMQTDLRGKNVLVSDKYFYFGANSPQLPGELDFLTARLRRGHRVHGENATFLFEKYARHLLKHPGVHGEPRDLEKRAKMLTYLQTT